MASASAHIHLAATDKPVVTLLSNGVAALWLTDQGAGPTLTGTPEALLEIRTAIGRYLFPDEFGQPEAASEAEAA